MTKIKDYPKYQYSVFLDSAKNEQVVTRSETWEEFKEAKKNIDKILKKKEVTPVQSTMADNAPMCPNHNIAMALRNGQYGDFWACPTKLPDGTWCKYKPVEIK